MSKVVKINLDDGTLIADVMEEIYEIKGDFDEALTDGLFEVYKAESFPWMPSEQSKDSRSQSGIGRDALGRGVSEQTGTNGTDEGEPSVSKVRFSISNSDSNGKKLSNEQAEYFKDSVVRDENGNLKPMYHGTSKGGHTVFDTYGSKYGLFGVGSYFTESTNMAESYTNKGKGTSPQVYETYPEHTQNVGNFGDEISIHMNRKSSSFTHTVRYAFGSQTGTIASGVGTGTTWVIPLSLMNLIPNATKGSGTIYVDTYNGSTKVGTKSCGFTASVPASVKPSVSVTLTDTTGTDSTYGSPVKGLSKIKVKATPTLAYSSPIVSYSISILIKKQISAFFSSMVSNKNAKKKPSVGIIILVAFLMLYLVVGLLMVMVALSVSACQPLVDNGYAWFYFAMPFGICLLISVFFGIFSSQGQIFNAKDNELLLSMPISPRDILVSRLLMMMAPDYLIELFVVAIFGIVYAVFYEVTLVGTLILCLLVLVLPLLAVAIYSLLGWGVSLITARIKRKQLVSSVISIAFLIVYFTAYSSFMEAMSGIEEGTEVGSLFEIFAPFADKVATYIPPIKWIGLSIVGHSAAYTLLVLAVTVIPFAVVIWLLSRSFIGIVTAKRGGKKTRYNSEGSVKTASAGKALYLRELKRTLNCSIYLTNAGIGAVMLIIAAALVTFNFDSDGMLAALGSEMQFVLRAIPLAVSLIICAISSTIVFTASSVSLEGKYLWIVRSLPVDTEKLLLSKVALHLTFALPASIIASGILCIVAKPTLTEIVPYFLLPISFNVVVALFGLIMNLRFPRFDWINEAQPVKQGLAVFLGMFVPFIAVIVIGVGAAAVSLVIAFMFGYTWIFAAVMAVLTVIFAILSLVFYNVLKKWGVRRFEKL